MAEHKVIRENFIVVQGWMIRDLQLKGNELIIYACIYGFSQAENQVFSGSLQYLADWTNSTKQGVVKSLKSLTEKGYIVKTDRIINGVKFCEYYATKFNEVLNKVEYPMQQSLMGGIKQSLTNNIGLNNIDNNIAEKIVEDKEPKRKRFVPPTLDEVKAYCQERQNGVDAERFIDYYTSNGWLVGKNKMKDWKAAVRTWERNGYSGQKQPQSSNKSYDTDEFFEAALRRSARDLYVDKPQPKTAGEDEAIRQKAEDLKARLG